MPGFPFYGANAGTNEVQVYRNISAVTAFSLARLPRKEHFNAARESLLGMRQTGNCRERDVFMVRTAEEVVLGQPPGGLESRSAFDDRAAG
jgi:hypothetical protein